jgi:hypothetical protein
MKSSATPPPPKTNFGEQKSLFWHPARIGNCTRAISIDSTAIFIAVAISHDKEGVVLPEAKGSTGSYVYISFSHDVIYM